MIRAPVYGRQCQVVSQTWQMGLFLTPRPLRAHWTTPAGTFPICSSRYPAQTTTMSEDSDCPRSAWQYFTYQLLLGTKHMQKHVKGRSNSLYHAFPTRLTSSKAMEHSDYRRCAFIDLSERFLGQIYLNRSALNRIT